MSSENLVEFKAGEIVIREKQAFEAIYVVKEGQLEACRLDRNGARVPLGLIQSGEFIGEMAYFLNGTHSSMVVALTDVKLAKIPKKVVEAQLKAVPKWLLALTTNLIKRLKYANDVLVRNNIRDEKLLTVIKAISVNTKKKSTSDDGE